MTDKIAVIVPILFTAWAEIEKRLREVWWRCKDCQTELSNKYIKLQEPLKNVVDEDNISVAFKFDNSLDIYVLNTEEKLSMYQCIEISSSSSKVISETGTQTAKNSHYNFTTKFKLPDLPNNFNLLYKFVDKLNNFDKDKFY